MADQVHALIALPTPVADDLLQQLRAVSPRLAVEMQVARSLAELGEQLSTAEVLLTSLDLPPAGQAPRLRWVQTYFAGVDGWLDRAGDRIKDITVTTASGVHGPNMATFYSDRGHGVRAPVVFAHRCN